VHFQGPLGELPQGKDGSYGTSIDIGWALDRERDVLLAFKQNGQLLTPDHGFPLRTLLPGCIGGRMIKWLCNMHVSDKPSENHYHYFDNRVLPPHVDAELATAEGWWYKPEYIINHMNINSAMFEPRHNSTFTPTKHKTLKVCGYAYTGGGNMIIRAEISLDSGRSWEIADLTRPEDEIAAARGTDKHWCWAWWETEVDVHRLEGCQEICCRAFDSNQNSQPFQLTWNVMGMLSNTIFRIGLHRMKDAQGNTMIWFEHPTMPGAESGGWMTEDAGKFDPSIASEASPGKTGVPPSRAVAAVWKGAGEDALAAGSKSAETKEVVKSQEGGKLVETNAQWLTQGITMKEVEKHNDKKSCWFVVKDRVYDGTPFLEDHPGGASSMLIVAGQEATEDFDATHSSKAWAMLEDYYMGPLAAESAVQPAELPLVRILSLFWQMIVSILLRSRSISSSTCFLQKTWQQLPLVRKIVVSSDTRIFRFGLPSSGMRLGLPTGMHMFLKAKINGETVMRPYSPMTDDSTAGHVDLLVKVYFAGVHPAFPKGGKMTQHLESLKIGDTIDVKGPIGDFVYTGKGSFTWKGKPRSCTHISMIAGGTGLTPCYQVLNAVLRDPQDKTQVCLLYANRSPEDILAKEELDKLAAAHPDRFKLSYTVDKKPDVAWSGRVGFVNGSMIQECLFPASKSNIVAMCGPPIMVEKACIPNLKTLSHEVDNIFEF